MGRWIMAKYDDMSFGKAFASARKEKGAGKTFTWKGNSYTTDRADDNKSSGGSSRDSVVERASRAIDRAEAERAPTMRPRSRPAGLGGEAPKVRPKARPEGLATRNAPTATRVETPSVTTSELAPSSQRASARTTPTSLKDVTIEDWARMSPAQRREMGLPNSRGAARAMLAGETSTTSTGSRNRRRPGGSTARGMAKGGMVKKSGYAKGGVVKANCGASMKPTQKGTKK
jgi:hypothetical protein